MSDSFQWTILRVGSLRECLDAWEKSPLYAQLSETFRTSTMIVLDEMGSNFLRFSGAKTKELIVSITFDGKELKMVLDDDGDRFDPTATPLPPKGNIALLPVGGRGLHMARKTMDAWFYSRPNNRNVTTLTKRVPPDPLALPEEPPPSGVA